MHQQDFNWWTAAYLAVDKANWPTFEPGRNLGT